MSSPTRYNLHLVVSLIPVTLILLVDDLRRLRAPLSPTNVWIHYAVRCCAEWLWGFIDACRHCPPRSEWILSFHRAPWNSSRPTDNDGQSTNHSDLSRTSITKGNARTLSVQNFYWSSWPCSDFFSSRPLFAYFISIELHRPSWKRETRE